jgi:hypothetical protein
MDLLEEHGTVASPQTKEWITLVGPSTLGGGLSSRRTSEGLPQENGHIPRCPDTKADGTTVAVTV